MLMSSLVVLWLSFAVIAWNSASGNLAWYLVFFCFAVGILLTLEEEPWIRGLFGYIPQAIIATLILSLVATFVIAFPVTIFLLVVPGASLYFAWQEVSYEFSAFFTPSNGGRLLILSTTALLGFGLGKVVDIIL